MIIKNAIGGGEGTAAGLAEHFFLGRGSILPPPPRGPSPGPSY